MDKIFKSQTSNDKISININKKTHRCFLNIDVVDDAVEHVKLINNIITELKKEDIKWVEMISNFSVVLPKNAVTYTNKRNNNTVCHIEDFEKFYFANIQSFIKLYNVSTQDNKDNDGWTVVMDKKKDRRDKYNKIKVDIVNLVGDWNSM